MHLMGVLVQDEVGHTHHAVVLVCGAVRPAQDGADARDHLLQPEGFGDVVVAPDRQTLHFIGHVVAGRQEEDGGGDVALPQPPGHGEAVHIREHDVEHDEVGVGRIDPVERAVPVRRRRHLEAGEPQRRGEQVTDIGLVVDDEQVSLVRRVGVLHAIHVCNCARRV
jgi:hypothetical protein